MPKRHGDPIEAPDPDSLPDWWLEDPDMWSGLSMSMEEYLAWERATEPNEESES